MWSLGRPSILAPAPSRAFTAGLWTFDNEAGMTKHCQSSWDNSVTFAFCKETELYKKNWLELLEQEAQSFEDSVVGI